MNTHRQIITAALASRLLILLAMAISCALLPDFDPGGDVLQFNLRLSSEQSDGCFCIQGYACDPSSSRNDVSDRNCAGEDIKVTNSYLDGIYRFILTPVTKWDSARFLTLAVNPWARYPNWDAEEASDLSDKVYITPEQDKSLFDSSEQSHAFLPFFPLCIRYVANTLVSVLPRSVLPSTYEATVAFSAILINATAFLVASLALYESTLYLLLGEQSLEETRRQSMHKKEKEQQSTPINSQNCETISKIVAMAFCLNPAGVFFTAAYSESIFAMLTFSGYAIAVKGCYFNHKAMSHPSVVNRCQSIWARWYPFLTNILWALASYTRSNGVLSTTAWWLLIGMGAACLKAKDSNCTINKRISFMTFHIYHFIMGISLFLPVLYHDHRGFDFHCKQQSSVIPEWCSNTGKFSLYAYVQRKHWNVGLL